MKHVRISSSDNNSRIHKSEFHSSSSSSRHHTTNSSSKWLLKMTTTTAIASLLLLQSLPCTYGYVTQVARTTTTIKQSSLVKLSATSMEGPKSLFSKIPTLFTDLVPSNSNRETSSSPTDPEALFSKARSIVSCDFGLQDASLLGDEFVWIGPTLYGKGLEKDDYLAAGNFFDLRSTFPDLDYRAHDYRIDSKDSLTVRITARTVGTMRGDLRLRTETIPANGKRMICPPEVISLTFDAQGDKLVKLTSGYCMDRLVGNTNGQCGVRAAATIAGVPPSEWDIYPPTVVISRFFGRNVNPVEIDTPDRNFVAPFPETVMIQLAKGVLAADNGASDPDLLDSSFTFCGPFVGPLKKDFFVKAFSNFNLKGAFPDLNAEYSNFRVDPFDPYRVWVDARGSGTNTGSSLAGKPPTGKRFESPPEAASLTFDDDGFCTRLTGGAVMDSSLGNTGGLGGVYGIFYGIGSPLPDIVSRPIPEIIERLKKTLLSPFTGIAVDDYSLPTSVKSTPGTTTLPPIVKPSPLPPPSQTLKVKLPTPPRKPPIVPQKPLTPLKKIPTSSSIPTKKTISKATITKPAVPAKKVTQPKRTTSKKTPAPGSKQAVAAAEKAMKIAKPRASINIFGLDIPLGEEKNNNVATSSSTKNPPAKATKPTTATAKTKKPIPGTKKAVKAAEKAMKTAKPRASINLFNMGSSTNSEEKPAKSNMSKPKTSKPVLAAPPKSSTPPDKKAVKAAVKVMKTAKPRATINLFGIGGGTAKESSSNKDTSIKKPTTTTSTTTTTTTIPVLKNWNVNKDKSITGKVFGSKSGFKNGSEITTSRIKNGEFKPGNTVTTASGSRYLLK